MHNPLKYFVFHESPIAGLSDEPIPVRRFPAAGFLAATMFFLFLTRSASSQLQLASELFQEDRWQDCERECRRLLLQVPSNPPALLMQGVSRVRLTPSDPAPLATLTFVAGQTNDPLARTLAAYELGRIVWAQGTNDTQAFFLLRQTFMETDSPSLFLRSGYCLNEMITETPAFLTREPQLDLFLRACQAQWIREIRVECVRRPHAGKAGLLSLPSRAIVALYRGLVRPAIGARCSLNPSCSAYFLQAGARHGLLAFPIAADRLVREPTETARGLPQAGSRTPAHRVADPLENHDFWLTR